MASEGRAVVRVVGGEKGGRGAGGEIPAESVDELAKGIRGVAEAGGSGVLGQALQEDGAESLVLALGGTGGLAEEDLAGGIVHARDSGCEVILFGDELYASPRRVRPQEGIRDTSPRGSPEKTGETGSGNGRRTGIAEKDDLPSERRSGRE
jgi:hypothetical protein